MASPDQAEHPTADAAAEQHIFMAAQLPECSSAADTAAKTQQAASGKVELWCIQCCPY